MTTNVLPMRSSDLRTSVRHSKENEVIGKSNVKTGKNGQKRVFGQDITNIKKNTVSGPVKPTAAKPKIRPRDSNAMVEAPRAKKPKPTQPRKYDDEIETTTYVPYTHQYSDPALEALDVHAFLRQPEFYGELKPAEIDCELSLIDPVLLLEEDLLPLPDVAEVEVDLLDSLSLSFSE